MTYKSINYFRQPCIRYRCVANRQVSRPMLESSSATDSSINGLREFMSGSSPKLDFQSPVSTTTGTHRSHAIQFTGSGDSVEHMESTIKHNLDMSQVNTINTMVNMINTISILGIKHAALNP